MQIVPSRSLNRPRPFRGLISPSVPQDSFAFSQGGSGLSEFWRDYGINPLNMAKRAFLDRPPEGGAALVSGTPGNAMVTDSLKKDLQQVVKLSDDLEAMQDNLVQTAKDYGVDIEVSKGLPIVNWDPVNPAQLDLQHSGGHSAYHEMVHAFQCTIGGATALGTAAAEQFAEANGRQPKSMEELKPFLDGLSVGQKTRAMQTFVEPMESQAYSTFEETAFHATGMMGKRSKNQALYQERLGNVVDAYVEAYAGAQVPEMETKLESKIYGGIGHIARTNGETALLLGGAGLAYWQLSKQAMKIHPLMGIPVATPLAYLLYRSMVSG